MKTLRRISVFTFAVALAAALCRAAIIVPGADGSDGELNITTNTVIDLSQAVTGSWDTNNAAHAGLGVYDPTKWAVVFKYTGVQIAAGATVTFKNHTSRAPVVWLVSGDVVINGTVSLDGQDYQTAPILAEPGPGGFRGGAGIYGPGVGGSAGFGVGGGGIFGWGQSYRSGSYASEGAGFQTAISPPYGNPSIIPIIGGSGGGSSTSKYGGAAGGGALLIACANAVAIEGQIHANGGQGRAIAFAEEQTSGSGSGGAIRIVATTLTGNGAVVAQGGAQTGGGLGRIRIERAINENHVTVVPDPSVVDLALGSDALIWPPNGAPEVKIVSIGAKNAPADPRAEFGTIGADIVLPLVNTTQVVVETTNIEQASQVKVRGTPRSNGNYTEVGAAVDSIVSNDPLVIRWKADLPVNAGYSAVQVKVVRP